MPTTTEVRTASASARAIDAEIAELVKRENAGAARIGALLLEMQEKKLYRAFQATSAADYACKRFKRSERWARELMELAESLRRLPRFAAACAAGQLPWTTAREATRAARQDGNEE